MEMINILMLGGKRCGKTTVLASMLGDANKALSGTQLRLEVDDETAAALTRARYTIQQKMADFKNPLTRVEVDDNPTSSMKGYNFKLFAGNKCIPFCIYDIPGEWLTDNHQKEVQALIKSCQVILIAIDTPYLFSKMTEKGYGFYHEEYNKPLEIANFFKNSLSVEQIEDRMILFVPIKCERYYHLTNSRELNISGRNYMQEIVDAVGLGYADMLSYLRSTPALRNNCTIAITPILSAGGIDFVHFRTDEETGKIVSLYQEPEFLKDHEKGYSPKYCEQPMVYSLVYMLLQEMTGQKRSSGIFRNINPEMLVDHYNTLRKKMIKNTGNYSQDGFYFIQNPKEI